MPKTIYEGPAGLPQARPQYGLPFRQLPGTAQEEVTPEMMLRREIKLGQKQIQDRFTLRWQEIDRSRRFIGNTKSARMLYQLHTEAKQEMQIFSQKAQMQIDQLRNVDKLVGVGGMDEAGAKKIKARMMYGPQVAETLYPEPGKERSIAQQFGELNVYSRRVDNILNQFRRPKERVKKWYLGEKKETMKLGNVQIWDINAPGKLNKSTNKIEHWRNASPEEIQTRNMYLSIQEDIKKRTRELYEQPGVQRRAVQPGASKGGGLNNMAAEAVESRQQIRRPLPTPKPELSDPLGLFP